MSLRCYKGTGKIEMFRGSWKPYLTPDGNVHARRKPPACRFERVSGVRLHCLPSLHQLCINVTFGKDVLFCRSQKSRKWERNKKIIWLYSGTRKTSVFPEYIGFNVRICFFRESWGCDRARCYEKKVHQLSSSEISFLIRADIQAVFIHMLSTWR